MSQQSVQSDKRASGDVLTAISDGLAVVPSHVRQLAQASPGRLVAERAVWSSEVVVPQPAGEHRRALG